MRLSFLFLLCLCALPVAAQKKFILDGNIKGLKDGEKIFLTYKADDQQVVDSTLSKAGRFQFKGTLTYPVQSSIVRGGNPLTNRQNARNTDFFRFYLEPATVTLQAKDSLKHGVITGSPVQDDYLAMNAMLKENNDLIDAVGREYRALSEEQKKDKALFDRLAARELELFKKSYGLQVEFARLHPRSYISVVCLFYAASEAGYVRQAQAAYDALAPEMKASPMGLMIPAKLASVNNTQIGKAAPDFTQNDVNDKPIKLSDFKGKYVLLDFWASWCGPCREENPNVVKAYTQYKERGFTVLGVSLDMPGQKNAWLKAIEKDQLPWTHVSDLKGWENAVAQFYGIQSVPANFLIDPTGKIIARDLRGEALQTELAKIFDKK